MALLSQYELLYFRQRMENLSLAGQDTYPGGTCRTLSPKSNLLILWRKKPKVHLSQKVTQKVHIPGGRWGRD